jgi:hypothetical protein
MNRARVLRVSQAILLLSVFYVVSASAWILSGNRAIITVMEVLTICAAVAILQLMIEVHRAASEAHRSTSLTAVMLTTAMAAVTIPNHFIYLTVLERLYPGATMPAWLLLDGWPSITKGLECVAWGLLLGLAMIFAAPALHSLGKAISWTMRISGIVTLAGLAGPVSGQMSWYLLSTAGYSLGFLALGIQLVLRFRVSKSEPLLSRPDVP